MTRPGAGTMALELAHGARSRLHVRGLSRTATQTLIACAIVPMVAVTLALAATSDHLERPVTAGLYWSYLTAAPMAIGLYWWMRRPGSRFGPLLIGFGALAWVASWQGANEPLLFDLGVLAEAPAWLLTIYLFLAFPTGQIEPRVARWLMAALGIGVVVTFLPWALFSPVIAGGGALTRCAPGCPENVLQIGSSTDVAEIAGRAETYVALSLTAAVFVVYLWRLVSATRPQRRALLAVAVTSLLFLPAYFALNFSYWILEITDVATLDAMAWAIVATRILLPLGFLVALVQAENFAGRALRTLLERLATRPSPAAWRGTIARSLDDPELRLGFHDPADGCFREPSGEVLAPPAPAHRVWVPVERAGHPVAAMVIDETLAADPELVQAAAAATLLAVENGALEGELQASRARILEAGHAERRRIERDLHDSAQQRLVALRIRLALLGERLEPSQEREMVERLGGEVDQAIDELRDLARGLYPQLLTQLGLVAALDAVARRSALPVRVRDHGIARHSEALETTMYFCCVECLQNAAKHAGLEASVTIGLSESDGRVTFSVEDDGVGFDPATVARGAGLTNLADRVAAVGGTLTVESRPGHGTLVRGELPAQPGPSAASW